MTKQEETVELIMQGNLQSGLIYLEEYKDQELKKLKKELQNYKNLYELAKKFKDHAEQKAFENYAAKVSLESEKDMNEILTNENDQLKDKADKLLEALEDIAESKYPEDIFPTLTDNDFEVVKRLLKQQDLTIDALSAHYGRIFQKIFQDRAKQAITNYK